MRTIKTSTGADIALDGDLLTVMETLFHEVTARRELERAASSLHRMGGRAVGTRASRSARSSASAPGRHGSGGTSRSVT